MARPASVGPALRLPVARADPASDAFFGEWPVDPRRRLETPKDQAWTA